MMQRQQRRMVAHGAVVIFIALLAGFGLLMALIGGFEVFPGTILMFELPGDTRAWARTHIGGITNGLLVMVGAFATYAMALPTKAATQLYWMLVVNSHAKLRRFSAS